MLLLMRVLLVNPWTTDCTRKDRRKKNDSGGNSTRGIKAIMMIHQKKVKVKRNHERSSIPENVCMCA